MRTGIWQRHLGNELHSFKNEDELVVWLLWLGKRFPVIGGAGGVCVTLISSRFTIYEIRPYFHAYLTNYENTLKTALAL